MFPSCGHMVALMREQVHADLGGCGPLRRSIIESCYFFLSYSNIIRMTTQREQQWEKQVKTTVELNINRNKKQSEWCGVKRKRETEITGVEVTFNRETEALFCLAVYRDKPSPSGASRDYSGARLCLFLLKFLCPKRKNGENFGVCLNIVMHYYSWGGSDLFGKL